MKKNNETRRLYRILELHSRLLKGEVINKREFANCNGVNERTVQRDIELLRAFYEEQRGTEEYKELIYSNVERGYYLKETREEQLSSGEILGICKILLGSRAFSKVEIRQVIKKIVQICSSKTDQTRVKKLMSNEEFHYVPLQHGKSLFSIIDTLGKAIDEQKNINIEYVKLDGKIIKRKLEPVGIIFSEYYFYLLAHICEDVKREKYVTPTIYRLDRIKEFKIMPTRFSVPYKDRFQEGDYRKYIQYMFGGKLKEVKFEYSGPSVEAVLDRLPTAIIKKNENGIYTISAEVFEPGIDMWLKSQGEYIKILDERYKNYGNVQ